MKQGLLELLKKYWKVDKIDDMRFMSPKKLIEFVDNNKDTPEIIIQALQVLVLTNQANTWDFARADYAKSQGLTKSEGEMRQVQMQIRTLCENSAETTANMERATASLKLQWKESQEAFEKYS